MMVDFLGARIDGSSDFEINYFDELCRVHLALCDCNDWNTEFVV